MEGYSFDQELDDSIKQRALEVIQDFSGGQFYILEGDEPKPLQFYLNCARTVNGMNVELTDWQRYVVNRLMNEVPPRLEKIALKQYIKRTRKQKTKGNEGYVYLIQSPTGAYKIGRSRVPEDRLRTFSVQLPFEIEYICLIKTPDMYALESALHRRFAAKRKNGEWFILDTADVEYIKGLAS